MEEAFHCPRDKYRQQAEDQYLGSDQEIPNPEQMDKPERIKSLKLDVKNFYDPCQNPGQTG